MPRRDVRSVMQDIVEILGSADGPLSTKEIAERKGLDWKTTEKYLEILSQLGSLGLIVKVKEGPRIKLWGLERRRLSSRPEYEQTEIIRREFPETDAKDKLLSRLLINGATGKERALDVSLGELEGAEELAKAGHLGLQEERAYLTETGITIAQGILKIYPELIKQT